MSSVRSEAASSTGAERLIAVLKRRGVDHLFGIPGVHTLPLYDALYHERAIRTVVVRHENGASCAADGFARVRRRASVCTAVPGPGATNLATGVLVAFNDSVPMVVITSQIPRRVRGRAAVHDCDLEALYRPLVKACLVVEEPHELEPALERAFELAERGRPGPVQVLMSVEALGTIDPSRIADPAPRLATSPPLPVASDAALDEAARLLNGARDPVIIAGDGVIDADAVELLRAVAERLQAVVFTSVSARGVVPERHPLCFGALAWEGAGDLLERADVALAVGTRFSEISTLNWSVPLPAQLIRVDIEPGELMANYPARLGIAADARQFLEALLSRLEPRAPGALVQQTAEIKARRAAELAATLEGSRGGPIHPLAVVAALRRAFPEDAIFTTDGTATEFWLSEPALELNRPRTLLLPEISQSMGYALPAAIGARLAAPDRPVACVTGDGSLTMALSELLTAVSLDINLPIVIFDDGLYNALRIYQDGLYGGRRMGTTLNNPDFLKLAAAVGAGAMRVERPDELEPALRQAQTARGVTLVDVAIDPRPLPTRYRKRLAQMTDLGRY